jgi:hypothetical protein
MSLTPKYLWFFLPIATLIYASLYAPYGLEHHDNGFMLGLSHQLYHGRSLYEEVVYIRPPLSPWLHSFVFWPPFNAAPILISRIFMLFQIACYSLLSALIIGDTFKLKSTQTLFMAVIGFMFCAHNHPVMAWHTIDGLFFSVLALYVFTRQSHSKTESKSALCMRYSLALCLAYCAALCKQNFALSPLILMGFILTAPTHFSDGTKQIKFLSCVYATATVGILLSLKFDLFSLWQTLTHSTMIHDLIFAGFKQYVQDWREGTSLLFSIPLGLCGLWATLSYDEPNTCSQRNTYSSLSLLTKYITKYMPLLTVLCTSWFFIGLWRHYQTTLGWTSPSVMVDQLFTITFLCACLLYHQRQERPRALLLAMHMLAWSASISWGYTTTLLYSFPSVSLIIVVADPLYSSRVLRRSISIISPILLFCIFFGGHQSLFSHESVIKRTEATIDLSDRYPALRGIYLTPEQAEELTELDALKERLNGTITVGPTWPFYHIILGGVNPIGADWLLDAELGLNQSKVSMRLSHIDYFIRSYRSQVFGLHREDHFGSKVCRELIRIWHPPNFNTTHFEVYQNPMSVDAPTIQSPR